MSAEYIIPLAMVLAAALLPLKLLPVMIWAERKMASFIQDRTGPNRATILGVRLGGVIHALADVVKLLAKEDMAPSNVSRFYYNLGPFLALFISMLPFAIVPLADSLIIGDAVVPLRAVTLNVGILFVLAITSFHVYAVVFGGWASNNTYAFLGALRSTAQMISYELGMGLSLIGLIMVTQTVDLGAIVSGQNGTFLGFLPKWNVFLQPLGFFIFLVALFAETNRNPFDLPEGESEIIGYHVEYSSMKFALFFMGEYVAIIAGCAVLATLYFGGWQVPFLSTDMLRDNALTVMRFVLTAQLVVCIGLTFLLLKWDYYLRSTFTDLRRHEARVLGVVVVLMAIGSIAGLLLVQSLSPMAAQVVVAITQASVLLGKILAFSMFFIWVRWTLPRFRYDQLMKLGWKTLIPLAILNIFITGIVLVVRG